MSNPDYDQVALQCQAEAAARCLPQEGADKRGKRAEFIKDFAAFLKQPSLWREPRPPVLEVMKRPPQLVLRLTDSHVEASKIMGANMLHLSDVELHLKVQFTAAQYTQLSIVPWSLEELLARQSTHVLFPGFPLTLNQIDGQLREPGYNWFGQYGIEPYASEVRVECRWHLIRRDIVACSTGKTWKQQKAMLPSEEHMPDDPTVTLLVALYFRVHRTRLFGEALLRTSSKVPGGLHVSLGFGSEGLSRFHNYSNDANPDIGFTSACNLPKS